jgi:hypothetical protein
LARRAGWKYLQTAHRLELAAGGPARLEAAAIAIRKEAAEKLNSWRKEAVKELLTTASGVALDPQKVCAAALLCDDHFNNEAYKSGLRRSNAMRLAISLLLAFLALLWIGKCGYLLAAIMAPADAGNLFKVLLTLAVFGWLGATVSAVIDMPKSGAPTRIPELVSTFQVTVLRVLMGPSSAIILYFVTQTQLSKMIFKLDVTNEGYIFLIIAFAAGFSERLVLRVIQAFDSKPRT